MKPKKKRGLRRVLAALMIVLVAAIESCPGLADTILTPYLQAVTTNGVYVLVECDSAKPVTVEYGPTSSYGGKATTETTETTASPQVTYVHNVKLTGLKSNTIYHYRVSQGGPPSADSTFITAAEPGTSFRFAWMGDCRGGTIPHEQIAARIKEAQPRFSLYGGDICSDESYNMFKQEFFLPNEMQLIAGTPFFLAVGNHEMWDVNTKAFTQSPQSASGTQDYYSFDYGDAHFVCVNNQVQYKAGSPQYDFVAKDLAESKKPWKIVFAHYPAYCVGGHNEDPDMVGMANNLFEPNGVDLVIGAHSHFYEHNLVKRIHYLIIGSAGAELMTPTTSSYTLKGASTYSYAIADVTPTTLHFAVYDDSGTILDILDLTTTSGAPEPAAPPAVPTRLNCRAWAPGAITVTWNPSTWASSYTLRRGTSAQGPFEVIKAGLTASTYIDTTVAKGTTYYYVVSASNAKGESPNSAPASARAR